MQQTCRLHIQRHTRFQVQFSLHWGSLCAANVLGWHLPRPHTCQQEMEPCDSWSMANGERDCPPLNQSQAGDESGLTLDQGSLHIAAAHWEKGKDRLREAWNLTQAGGSLYVIQFQKYKFIKKVNIYLELKEHNIIFLNAKCHRHHKIQKRERDIFINLLPDTSLYTFSHNFLSTFSWIASSCDNCVMVNKENIKKYNCLSSSIYYSKLSALLIISKTFFSITICYQWCIQIFRNVIRFSWNSIKLFFSHMAIKFRTIFQSLATGSAPLKGKISSTIQILPAPGTTGLAHGFIHPMPGLAQHNGCWDYFWKPFLHKGS